MRCRKGRTRCPILMFVQVIHHIQGLMRGTSPEVTTAFHAETDGRFVEIKSNFRKRNFLERIKEPIFFRCSFINRFNRRTPIQSELRDHSISY